MSRVPPPYPTSPPDARSRVLDAAEVLFSSRGYASVTLRGIAESLGLKHSALYYHFPGGKDELFVQVMERNIRRHGQGLAEAMEASDGSLRGKLAGVSAWLLSQPPMDLIRMTQSDLAALKPESARRLMDLIYELILLRLQRAFEDSSRSGEIGSCDPGLLAGGVFGIVENLHAAPVKIVRRERLAMAMDLLDVILKGLDYNPSEKRKESKHVGG